MNDNNVFSRLQNVIEHYKQEAVEILRHRLTDDEIEALCGRFVNADEGTDLQQQFETEGYSKEIYSAVISLSYIMYLERNVPPDSTSVVPSGFVANLVLVGFGAGMFLVEAGWKPSEPFALTRLAQYLNQPTSRKHKLNEKHNIFEMLELYVEEKGHHPKNKGNFLMYLNANGYEIDSVSLTVDAPVGSGLEWKKPIAIGTIDNWRREYKKVHR